MSLYLILKFIFSVFLFITILKLFTYIKENNTTGKIYEFSENNYKLRRSIKEKIRIEEGNVKEKSFLRKIDLLIERSRIRKIIPFLNTEIYIAINIILVTVFFTIGILKFKFWLTGVVFSVIILIGLYFILYVLSGINYEKVDKEVMTFINIMENYSGTNDDITLIMKKTYPYLKEPLKTYIEEFCQEVHSTGDIKESFRKFEARIENERVKDIIRNLEICSRHEANYKEIIRDVRETLKDYLKSKEERKAIVRSKRIEMGMCLGISGVILMINNSFVTNMWTLLKTTPVGNGILLYCIIVLSICIYSVIGFDKKG